MPLAAVSGEEIPYKIGPGDALEISVWKDADLTRQILVPPDGILSLPLIEDIPVKNRTVAELEKLITEKLSEFVSDASVTVMLIQANSLKAYVIGKVNNPGVFPIGLETNIMQILAMAGGLNPYAASGKIIILRKQAEDMIKIPFDYDEVKKGKHLEQNIILKRGDVVVVP
ncbi:MAG: polysaccharide biosynthesis/export family protein [Deltaproteobacteria bacterium]|nr:polysaccharide biosynthesis/export family protein [Deltaproteobacteria bacterium]